MPENILEKLENKKNELILERDKYGYSKEDIEIERASTSMNELLQRRNSLKDVYDSYQKEITKLEGIARDLEELLTEPAVPVEPSEEEIEMIPVTGPSEEEKEEI